MSDASFDMALRPPFCNRGGIYGANSRLVHSCSWVCGASRPSCS